VSRSTIPTALRKKISMLAQYRCGYCLTQEVIVGMPMVIDHIIPEAKGGLNDELNLWLACRRCNEYKGVQVDCLDEKTGETVPLFNPRTDNWDQHFEWVKVGIEIQGKTSIGRATTIALNLNNDYTVRSRKRWVSVNWHPPKT
jgi:hypothetical protein